MKRKKRGGEVVDLDRERRLQEHTEALRALLAGNPRLQERTNAMLAGELPCPDLEEPMSKTPNPTVVRIPGDLVARCQALMPLLEQEPDLAAVGRLTTSAVIRVALSRGLVSLEEQYKGKRKAK